MKQTKNPLKISPRLPKPPKSWIKPNHHHQKNQQIQQQLISECEAKGIYRWVSSMTSVNQSAETGWAAGCCSCPGLSSWTRAGRCLSDVPQTSVWRGRARYLPPNNTIWVYLCQVPFILGWEGEGQITCVSGSCQNQACLPLGNQNLTHLSCASHDSLLCLGLFWKITRWPWTLFALQTMTTRACSHYLAGAALYRQTCPGIFFLMSCTLAAFTLPFSLPSPIHLSWWKKLCDKQFKTGSGTEEDFFYWFLDFPSTFCFQTNFLSSCPL